MSYPNYVKYNNYKNCCKPIGVQGAQGADGPRGLIGPIGPQGAQGATGSVSGSVSYGELTKISGTTTTTLANQYYGIIDASFGLHSGITFTDGSGGIFPSIGSPDTLNTTTSGGVYQAVVNLSIEVDVSANITAAISRNGTVISDTEVQRFFQNTPTNSSGSFSITTLIDASLNDTFGIIIQSDVSNNIINNQ